MLLGTTTLSFISFISMANAHAFIQGIKGANGKTANGFGVNAASIKPNNQGPASVFRDASAPCGVGVEAGKIDVASSIEAAITAGLPTTDANGSISMIWQQINAGNDGGGPGTAAIDVTGTGTAFKPLTITKNFADGGANSANPMTVQLPAGTVCTGGSNKATCLIKVTNSAGPFGSCLAIASPASGGGGGNVAVAPAASPSAAATTVTTAPAVTNQAKKGGRRRKRPAQAAAQKRRFARRALHARHVQDMLPRAEAADFGKCGVPKIAFGLFDGRKDNSFSPVGTDFVHGSALNAGVITGFICSQLNGQCKANAAALSNCQSAIAATKGLTGQAVADAFNAAVAARV